MANESDKEEDQQYPLGKQHPDENEASGRAKNMRACYVDDALNYWDGSWSGFTCWRCGARNSV